MKTICTLLLVFLVVLPYASSAQSTDSSSYFPLGLWGIWIDRRTAPYTEDLNIDQWDQEKDDGSSIECKKGVESE